MNEDTGKTEKLEYQTEEKIEGFAEPLEGKKDIESEPAQEETAGGESAPKRKRRIVVAAVLGVAVIALCVAGIVAAATPSEAPDTNQRQQEQKQEEQEQPAPALKPSLAVNIKAEGWDDSATKARILLEATAPHGVAEPVELDVACNEDVVIVEADDFLKDVEYKVTVVQAPVLEDGSTFTAGAVVGLELDSRNESTARILATDGDGGLLTMSETVDQGNEYVVSYADRDDVLVRTSKDPVDDATRMVLEITLAPKALTDMSAEEVEASASALEAAGKSDAAQAAVQSAPSTSGNAAQSGGAGSGSTSGGGSSEPAPAPTPTPGPDPAPAPAPEPDPPAHVHNWIPETTEQTVYHNFCNLCNTDIQGNETGHMDYHIDRGEDPKGWHSGAAGTETVNTGRYYCSCGEWK